MRDVLNSSRRAVASRARLLAVAAAAGALAFALAGCGSTPPDPTGFTPRERKAAQATLDAFQNTNISFQLIAMTQLTQSVPSACQVRLVSQDPPTYKIYLFWIPWLAAEPYVWLNMDVPADPKASTLKLGLSEPILPGGRLSRDGQSINRGSVDTTLLSRYGADQEKKSQALLREHGGDVFAKPSAKCQVLKNGAIRLLPAPKG